MIDRPSNLTASGRTGLASRESFGPIDNALIHVEEDFVHLEERVAELQARLQPYSRSRAEPTEKEPPELRDVASPYRSRLEDVHTRIKRAISNLAATITCLE